MKGYLIGKTSGKSLPGAIGKYPYTPLLAPTLEIGVVLFNYLGEDVFGIRYRLLEP